MSATQPKPIKYTFEADSRKFAQEARRVENSLEDISKQAVLTDKALDLDVDVDDSALTILRRRLIAERAQLERDIQIDVDLDAGVALRRLRTLDRQIKGIDKQINVDVATDRDMLRGALDESVKGAEASASGGGSFLGTLLAVGIGQGLRDGVVDAIQKSLEARKGALSEMAGTVISVRVDDAKANAKAKKAVRDYNLEWERVARTQARISASDGGFRLLFDKDIRSEGLRALSDRMRKFGDENARVNREVNLFGKRLQFSTISMKGLGSAMGGATVAAGGLSTAVLGVGAALLAAAAAAAGPGIVGGGIAYGLTQGAIGLLDAYDQIDKGNRRARIVFDDNLKIMQDWADALSTQVGMGRQEVLAQAAAVGDLLVPRGFNRKDTADITQQIVERGAALGEWAGVDTAQAVDAVSKALLGEREQLKGLGVQIRQSDVDGWIKKNKDAVRGMSDGQAEVIATLALVEAGSTDAWEAWNSGASDADNALDTLNATLANLKTDAIEGFGGILADLVGDFGALNTEAFNLGDWIKANEEKIRAFFLDLALVIADGTLSMLDLASAITIALIDTAPMVADFMRVMGNLAANSQIAAGAMLALSPATRGMGLELIATSGQTRDLADSLADAYENGINAFGPDVLAGIEAAKGGVEGFRDKVMDLKEIDALRIELTAALEEGSVEDVKGRLQYMSEPSLALLIATLDSPSATKTEKELAELAKGRKAEIEATPVNFGLTQRDLDWLARDRDVNMTIRYKGYNIPKYLARPDLPVGRAAASLPSLNRAAYARGGDGITLWEGGAGGTTTLAPQRRDDTQVNVYLDSRQIASYLQPAGSATEPRTRRP